jgi:cold shock CspA family protein
MVPDTAVKCCIESEEKRYTGIVVKYQKERSFAFINSEAHGELYFNKASLLHVRDWYRLDTGSKVEYSLGSNTKGECAAKVRPFEENKMRGRLEGDPSLGSSGVGPS